MPLATANAGTDMHLQSHPPLLGPKLMAVCRPAGEPSAALPARPAPPANVAFGGTLHPTTMRGPQQQQQQALPATLGRPKQERFNRTRPRQVSKDHVLLGCMQAWWTLPGRCALLAVPLQSSGHSIRLALWQYCGTLQLISPPCPCLSGQLSSCNLVRFE